MSSQGLEASEQEMLESFADEAEEEDNGSASGQSD